MDSPQVIAAWIAAVAAILSTVASIFTGVRAARLSREVAVLVAEKSTETQLIVEALSHLIGGSQKRAAGLSALQILKAITPDARWNYYDKSARQLIATQVEYVLTGGSNRWEAHEIQNIREGARWFVHNGQWTRDERYSELKNAALRYIDNWQHSEGGGSRVDGKEYKDGGRANVAAIEAVIRDLKKWFSG
jgi:hypothetical protein